MDVQLYATKPIRELLQAENIKFSVLNDPAINLASLWAEGSAILVVFETNYYILTKVTEINHSLNLMNLKKNILISAILEETLLKTPLIQLPCIEKRNTALSFEETIDCFFNAKLDYLYFSNSNTLISFQDNLSIIHNFFQKKVQQLEAQHTLKINSIEKNEQLLRALKYDLRQYQVTMYIPGMCWIGKLGKLIQPRLGNLYQYHPQSLAVPKLIAKKIPNPPKISIVTPSFEQGRYLENTIQSVLQQNYPNIEYVVKDGGSKDNSREILERYKEKLTHWSSTPDNGQSHAINVGFSHTSGEIMAWLNSDDLLLPEALHCVAEYFNAHPEIDVLYGNRLLIDENNSEIGRWILPRHSNSTLSWADFIPQETLFWRRRIWDKIGGQIDESFRFAMDWDLLIRFRDAGAQFAHIPYFLGAFRVHINQKTSAATDIGSYETKRIQKRIFGKVPSRMRVRLAVTPYILQHIAVNFVYLITYMLRRNKYKPVFNEPDTMNLDT